MVKKKSQEHQTLNSSRIHTLYVKDSRDARSFYHPDFFFFVLRRANKEEESKDVSRLCEKCKCIVFMIFGVFFFLSWTGC